EHARNLVQEQLAVAHNVLRVSQRQLALRLRTLYEQQDADPLAVVLGAQSLEEAIAGLDDLSRTAQQNKRVASESRHAQYSLRDLLRSLAAREAQVRALEAAAAQTTASLRATRLAREGYLANLASRQRLNAAQIVQLDAQARVSVARSEAL